MKEFDKRKNGELYEQLWVKEEAKKFYIQINSLANKFHCPLCGELWPCEKPICETCKKDKEGKFTRANDMVPNLNNLPIEIQKYFEDLTMIEEQLISPISAIMTVFRQPGGQLFNRGYCASFTKKLEPLCKILPRLTRDISLIIIEKKDKSNINKEFIVNRHRIENVLRYLCNNNELWKSHGIQINIDNLASLPENDVPLDLHIIPDIESEYEHAPDNGPILHDQSVIEEDESNINTYIDVEEKSLTECDKIRHRLKFPEINPLPLNEFDYDGIISLVFPKLFPNCLGDPTIKARLHRVTETEGYRHLIKFACKKAYSDELYYPFAQHPRFMFYANDRLTRHRTLDQSKVYLKQNPADANITISELKEAIRTDNGINVVGRKL